MPSTPVIRASDDYDDGWQDAFDEITPALLEALKEIAGASWGHVAPNYERGTPMTAKDLTIDVAQKAVEAFEAKYGKK